MSAARIVASLRSTGCTLINGVSVGQNRIAMLIGFDHSTVRSGRRGATPAVIASLIAPAAMLGRRNQTFAQAPQMLLDGETSNYALFAAIAIPENARSAPRGRRTRARCGL